VALVGKKYDLDLSRMGDEELVVLAQECGYGPAASELIVRYHKWMYHLVARKARGTRLSAADVQDAQQNAVFAIKEAIDHYNALELGKQKGCSFRTFLRQVLTRRFVDFVRQVKRDRKHFDRSPRGADVLEEDNSPCGRRPIRRDAPHAGTGDPADTAAWRELMARLHVAVGRLGEEARALWERLASGASLRVIAEEMGVSYDVAKRRRQTLLAQLTAELREGCS
jgi:RNA polymerase sigma factor (sigma-70 family)